ncbi:hypothetical protein KNU84_gp076 [Bacteriophage DSS3_VP1]|uniref:Uncharacterized protein n=1 Tax=Bacteriophage DSS3_VP1 TaxID=2664196 RepID=A0A7S5KQC1_9CAUD|nr:hypothetical protein KNU84_gp076 [Bacteriophage DSS3_VP1]QGH74628.1 hypothetical protein DSS3VP1_00060 [Bacteriophage DSS3_VP1]
MQLAHLNRIESEAERFLERIQRYKDRLARDQYFARYHDINGSPESGAVRRSSLDLSRELTQFRNGYRSY